MRIKKTNAHPYTLKDGRVIFDELAFQQVRDEFRETMRQIQDDIWRKQVIAERSDLWLIEGRRLRAYPTQSEETTS